jgi:ABC-type nitrate/sulfonate/bicarbonate transport system substrate-binding protein
MIARRILLCGIGAAAFAHRARAATRVTLAISSNSLAYGGLRIAQGAGLFEKNGITPAITVMDNGNATLAAVISGSVEFCSDSPGGVLAARVRGQKIAIVANIYRGLSGSLVLAKAVADKLGSPAEASIEAKLNALNGLIVATPSPTSSYTYPYKIAAQAVGAKPRFTYMSQPAMLAALKAGAVQGIVAGAPFSTDAVANGSGVTWISGPKGELPSSAQPTSSACVETGAAYAAAHPDVIAQLRTGFAALATFIKGQPDDAERLLARAYPELSADTIAAVFHENGPNWARPTMTVADIRQEIALQEKSGILPGVSVVDPASVLLS